MVFPLVNAVAYLVFHSLLIIESPYAFENYSYISMHTGYSQTGQYAASHVQGPNNAVEGCRPHPDGGGDGDNAHFLRLARVLLYI